MRRCHIVFNNADVAGGTRADVAALAGANTFAYNWPTPGCIDVFGFPPERTASAPVIAHFAPERELAPWSPQFTVATGANRPTMYGGPPLPVRFPRTDDVALLTG
jgi:hypothetical protein